MSILTLRLRSPSRSIISPLLFYHRSLATAPGQNLIEKIIQKYAIDVEPGTKVQSGDFVSIQPEHVLTHDNTMAVMSKFKTIGAAKFNNPRQPVFALDHDVQNKSEKNLAKYSAIEKFAKTHNVDFYPAGRGIGHQIMVEEGYAFPYTLTVASDSHSNMYGGIGCLGTPIVRTDAAAIWATGRTWWQIPPVVKVSLDGELPKGVTGKDIIITLCGYFNRDEVLNTAIEFTGDGVKSLSIDERLAIANMTTEWGALAGVFPVDERTIGWLNDRVKKIESVTKFSNPNIIDKTRQHPRVNKDRIQSIITNPIIPDNNAYYSKHLSLDLSTLQPYVSGPNSVKAYRSVGDMQKEKVKIHKAYLVSCVNSRVEDIKAAADVIKGKKVKEGVEFYVAPASSEVRKEVEESGHWQQLIDAGAKVLPAGCGPCVGLGTGLLKDGEVGISATNRNFKGRMGSPNAFAYLASPAVVAQSAVNGYISSPPSIATSSSAPQGTITTHKPAPSSSAPSKILPGFPEKLQGDILFCFQDNLNTDGIYPGKYTYQDDLTPAQMAKVVMENYDTQFVKKVQKSDILLGGFNFGTGSSREQAATALKSAGIPLVLAGSFSETFKRNALNNGLLVLEAPELAETIKTMYGGNELTKRIGWNVEVDLARGIVKVLQGEGEVKEFKVAKVGMAAQELMLEGGLEQWVKNRI
ncbi:aconitase A [Paraphysoderma sedebokerense]|nr:aconitase A [Paraphysoderma sedebokerense]KAI9141310.1 aconitase A [Paraphysoderma sedebokerense]